MAKPIAMSYKMGANTMTWNCSHTLFNCNR